MLYEKLNERDSEIFGEYVKNYAPSNDAEIYEVYKGPEAVLREWGNAKSQYLYSLFGEQFIVEKEVEFEKPSGELQREVLDSLHYGELGNFQNLFESKLAEVVTDRWSDEFYYMLRLFNYENLASNLLNNFPLRVEITFNNGEKIVLNRGAKTMKMMGKVSKMLGISDEFEQFRLKHSLLLNQKKVTGTLCLSIHPLDYITMSDNSNNWCSCMSWMNDGEYRMGTVEMMNSPCVVVAYLKSSNESLRFCGCEWNSKRWRTLIIVDRNVICSIKNYPYENKDLTFAAIEMLREMGRERLGWDFPNPISEIREGCRFEMDGEDRVIEFYTTHMYNDFGAATHYGIISSEMGSRYSLCYSGAATCMFCGSADHIYEEHNYVLCSHCSSGYEELYYCDCCGRTIYEGEGYWMNGEVPICEYCFDEHGTTCDFSSEHIWNDDAVTVFLATEDDHPNEDADSNITIHERYLSSDRYDEYSWLTSYFKRKPHCDENDIYYWNVDDVTDDGLRYYFGTIRGDYRAG